MTARTAAVLAVDGGNSKADLALVARDGTLLAVAHGTTISHQAVDLEVGMQRLDEMARRAAAEAGIGWRSGPLAEVGLFCLAGADSPADTRSLLAALRATGLTRTTTVLNDSRAGLRAGTDRGWGVVVVCGAGVNGSGVAPDGRSVSLRGIGPISGDWGGSGDVGLAALQAAVRARDGRGPRTRLEHSVPGHFGLSRPQAVTEALNAGDFDQSRLRELAPVVFATAAEGDAAARGIVDRLADELATIAIAMIRRLRLVQADPDVVLIGGIFRARDQAFIARVTERVQAVAPNARLVTLDQPPVLGAALLGLDRLIPRPGLAATQRLREAFAARRG